MSMLVRCMSAREAGVLGRSERTGGGTVRWRTLPAIEEVRRQSRNKRHRKAAG
jgi:hypothetical protein